MTFVYGSSEMLYMGLCLIVPAFFIVCGLIFGKGKKDQ